MHKHHLPALTLLCLRVLASYPNPEFAEDIAPYIPVHLRRELIRDAAVLSPLPNVKLYALYEPDKHADSELLIVGPNATLKDGFFIRGTSNASAFASNELESESWDSEISTPEPLTTFILVSTSLAASSLLSLPPTITRMALVNLSTPISIHRLPSTCPMLVVLDLSYNTWLAHEDNAEKILGRVEWSRWDRLRVIGLRECHVPDLVRERLNKSRWDDVEVIQ